MNIIKNPGSKPTMTAVEVGNKTSLSSAFHQKWLHGEDDYYLFTDLNPNNKRFMVW